MTNYLKDMMVLIKKILILMNNIKKTRQEMNMDWIEIILKMKNLEFVYL